MTVDLTAATLAAHRIDFDTTTSRGMTAANWWCACGQGGRASVPRVAGERHQAQAVIAAFGAAWAQVARSC